MASSDLVAIYAAIAAMSVSAASQTPTVWDLDDIRDSLHTAQLPVRILLPSGNFNTGGAATFAPVTINSIAKGTWQIIDLCLWRPLGQGLGMRDIGATLAEYSGAYASALVARGRAVTHQSYITGCDITAGVYAYPDQSENLFWGVRCIVQVDEIIS